MSVKPQIYAALVDADGTILAITADGLEVQGGVAHDATDSGKPLKVGGKAETAAPSAVADGDRVDAFFDEYGKLIVGIAGDGGGNQLEVAVSGSDGIANNGTFRLPTNDVLYALAPDMALDRVRTLGDTVLLGLGQLAAAPWIPGASTVKTKVVAIGATSASINTAIDPTSGKKIRVLSLGISAKVSTAPDKVGVYFGTGAAYLTNPASAIHEFYLGTTGEGFVSWPDGGGPVGAADDNLSWVTETETETGMDLTIVYREE